MGRGTSERPLALVPLAPASSVIELRTLLVQLHDYLLRLPYAHKASCFYHIDPIACDCAFASVAAPLYKARTLYSTDTAVLTPAGIRDDYEDLSAAFEAFKTHYPDSCTTFPCPCGIQTAQAYFTKLLAFLATRMV